MDALCCRPDHNPHTVLLSAVVVHTAITILTRSRLDIMQPLFKMVYNSGDLQVRSNLSGKLVVFANTLEQFTEPVCSSYN